LHKNYLYDPSGPIVSQAQRDMLALLEIAAHALQPTLPENPALIILRARLVIWVGGGSRGLAACKVAKEIRAIRSNPTRHALELEACGKLERLVRGARPQLILARSVFPLPPEPPDGNRNPGPGEKPLELIDDVELDWRIRSGLSSGPPPSPQNEEPCRRREPGQGSERSHKSEKAPDLSSVFNPYAIGIAETADLCPAEAVS
jgi:hypothetical protein